MKKTTVAISSLPLLTLAAAGAVEAAYYYEAKTTVEGEGLGGAQSSTVRAWVDGVNAKVEFQDGDPSGLFGAGSYLLTNDAGETLYVVNPAERTLSEIDLAQIFQMVGALTEATGGMVKFEFADFSSEKLGEEPGEEILGYPTTRHRFKSGYTMRIAVLGMTRENRSETEQELSCTDEIDAAAFDVWLRPDRFRTGNEDIDRLIAQQYATVDCLPLRNRMVTTMAGQGGPGSSTTTTTEVTTLREEAAPQDTFVLPAGYELTPLIRELPAGAEGGALGGGDAARDEAEPGRRPRLRDLIGR